MFMLSRGIDMDIETEIRNLKQRVRDLEIAAHNVTARPDTLQRELVIQGEATMKGFDLISTTIERLVVRMDKMNTQVWGLRDDLPILMAEALAKSNKQLD